ncbi:hypothetical protein RND81_07G179300 [Saponaria officinalis]|uniref:Glycosyltransferase 61 catalytic domain-containing protein n=1 Tax=Saponaria officinalis TaxID=3572 RepID=A0AAW1JV00_SAPOF
MKQKQRIENTCLVFILLIIAVQISLMLIIRLTSPTNQGHEYMTSLECNGSQSTSWALLRSIKGGPIICDKTHDNYDWCVLNHPTILDPNISTFFTIGSRSNNPSQKPLIEKVKPYPRKWEPLTMSLISEVTLTTSSLNKPCDIHHESPALVFSVSGYTGNLFHDFNDGIIPLYVTINTLFPNQHVTLLVANYTNWWHSKYEVLLRAMTKYRVINYDNQTALNCFPSVAVGLISHGSMTIDPSLTPNKRSYLDFRSLLEAAYRDCHGKTPPSLQPGKPRLVFATRIGNVGRVILNQNDIIEVAEKVGFEVVLFQPTKYTYLCDAYNLINSSHGMIGVHGAALTHTLFLRPGSVMFQIVPIGNEWLANSYFKSVAKGLNLQYVEYMIKGNESSLAQKYGLNHLILRNPKAFVNGNWSQIDNVYLKGQNVRLDLNRFKNYLEIAYSKAMRFMDNNG